CKIKSMLGRALAVSVLTFLQTLPALPQCNLSPVASAQFRSTILDVAIDGNRLWAATSYGITIYDATADPPLILDSIALPGTTRAVRAANGIGYAASGNAIQVVRWDGRSLVLVRSIDAGAVVNDLLLTPTHLYAATSNGIAQYDLLNAAAPAKTAATFAVSGGNVTMLAASGNALYAADGDPSVEVCNILAPSQPLRQTPFITL